MSRQLIADDTLAYCEAHSTPQDATLREVYRDIQLHTAVPHNSTSPYMGHVVSTLCKMIRPMVAVELGVFGGYGTICIARGLADGGRLYAIEAEEEYEPMIRRHLHTAAVDSSVDLMIGKALDVIVELPDNIDFAFIDADKLNYINYYEALLPKMSRGGWLLFDNMLWYGNVVNHHTDATTQLLSSLNDKIASDPRVECLMLPLGDGVMVCRVM